jgi:hypothetical protein
MDRRMHFGNFAPVLRSFPPVTRVILFSFLLCATCSPALAQRFYVRLSGTVTEYFSGAPLRGVTVRLLKAGDTETEMVTRRDGRYEFTLDRGWRYTVYYSRKGMVTKHVVIDTQDVPPYPDVPFYDMDVQMTLFDWIDGFDLTAFEQPLGEAMYRPKLRNMSWDVEYTERLRPVLSKVMDEYEKTAKGYYDRTRTGRRPKDERITAPAAPPDTQPRHSE